MPIGAIIGAVIAGGAAIIGGVINSNDVEEANKIGLQTYNQEREDRLKNEAYQKKMDKFSMGMQKKQFAFSKQQFAQGVKERESDRQYGKRMNFDAKNMNMVNQNAQLRSVFMNTMTRR